MLSLQQKGESFAVNMKILNLQKTSNWNFNIGW